MTEIRNPRKLRVWEQKTVAETLQLVSQFQTKIDAILQGGDGKLTLADLPASLVPTDTFYAICICFMTMYEDLTDEGLIKSGNTKTTQTIH